MAKYTKQ